MTKNSIFRQAYTRKQKLINTGYDYQGKKGPESKLRSSIVDEGIYDKLFPVAWRRHHVYFYRGGDGQCG